MQLLPRIFDGIIKYSPKPLGEYAVDYFQTLSATDYDTIAYSGTNYKVYHTFTIPWCGTQAGNVKPIQLTKRIKLYADHYANKPSGVINAKQWATSNGFDVEGIENLADLDFYVGTETNLSAYPYLMSKQTLDKLGGFSNFLAYVQSQSSEYVIPVVMADLYSFYTRAGAGVSLLPEEIQNAPAISSAPLPLHAGDSGKPVFLTVDDYEGNRKDILLTHIYQLTNGYGSVPIQGFGSNMTKAFDIIKAFCDANNEQLNVFEVNSMTTDNMTALSLNGKEVKELYINSKLAWKKSNPLTRFKVGSNWIEVDIVGELGTEQIPSEAEAASEVEVGSHVTSLGNSAFNGLTNLRTITVPDSVKSFGSDVFYGCTGLESVTIADNSISSIGDLVFSGCTNLQEIALPAGLTTVGKGTFTNCSHLTSVTLPAGLTSISESMFSGCSYLLNITIPDSATSIGDSAFESCTGLSRIVIPNNVTSIGVAAFLDCSNLYNLTIGNSVTSIGDSAFENCTSLTSLSIPSSVQTIGNSSFLNCTGLMGLLMIPYGVRTIDAYAFGGCSHIQSLHISNSVTSIGDDAFYGCTSVNTVECEPNPANLTWTDNKDDFKADGSTVCKVFSQYLSAYQTKFGSTVNVTFTGDL